MKSLIYKLTILMAMVFTLGSCYTTSPIGGFLFTNTYSHLDHDYLLSGVDTIGDARILKKGYDCHWTIFPLNVIYEGSGMSMDRAMAQGGISKVAVVDYESINVLGPIFHENCIVVYGE